MHGLGKQKQKREQKEKQKTKREKTMNKKDKKFIAALVLLQTGILATVISASGSYWHNQIAECKKIANLATLVESVKGENKKIEAGEKIQKLKQHYQTQGVRVEEH